MSQILTKCIPRCVELYYVPPQLMTMSSNGGTGAEPGGNACGAMVGAGIGAPSSNTSMPLICGLSLFRTKSIVTAPSVMKVESVTTYGTLLPGATANMSKLSTTSTPPTNTSNIRALAFL